MTLTFKDIDNLEKIEIATIQKKYFFKKIDIFINYIESLSIEKREIKVSFNENYLTINHIYNDLLKLKSFFEKRQLDIESSYYKKTQRILKMLVSIQNYFIEIDFMDSILIQLSTQQKSKLEILIKKLRKNKYIYDFDNLLYPIYNSFSNYNLFFYYEVFSIAGFDIFTHSFLQFSLNEYLLSEVTKIDKDFLTAFNEKKSILKNISNF